MSIVYEERQSDSPYIETVTHGYTVCDGSTIRPAEFHWHMVFVRHHGGMRPLAVGPWSKAGTVSWLEGAEILWIRFTPGTFLSHLPVRKLLDKETLLPEAAGASFWLNGSAWQMPDYDNVETFVARLAREDGLVRDPVVDAALKDQPQDISPRTMRHHFLHSTGLTRSHIRQVERAQRAAALLRQGVSILDTVHEAGYFDQPHLTRSLKAFIGKTPAQLLHSSKSAVRVLARQRERQHG